MLSRCLRRRGDLARATRHVEIAARIAPELPGLAFEAALVGIARANADGGERAETTPTASETLRGSIRKELEARGMPSERIDALEAIGAMLELGLVGEADEAMRKRFGSTSPLEDPKLGRDPAALRIAARLALEAGDLSRGRAISRRLLRIDPSSLVALHNLTLIAIRRARLDAAGGWLERARKAAPADAGLRKLGALLFWARVRVKIRRWIGIT